MAKVVGLVGAASGKIGNLVYAVTNGIQTARVYQPIVANPKSSGQMAQRAKANLAGRISKVTPKEAIIGLGSDGRERRGAFLSNILRNATVSETSGVFAAKLQPNNLTFSKGSAIPVISVSGITVNTSGLVTVSYSRITYANDAKWAVAGGMFVTVVIDDATGGYDFVQVDLWQKGDIPPIGQVLTQEIKIEPVGNQDVFVYFVPWMSVSNLGATLTNGLGIENSAYVAGTNLTVPVSGVEFGTSKFLALATPVNV